ncbi:permease, partial [Staphylococcus sp. SIMBA_130]
MIGISIATKWEYEATLEYFGVKDNERFAYPYGEFF